MVDLEQGPSEDEKVDGVVRDAAQVGRRPDHVDPVPHSSFCYLSRVKTVHTARKRGYTKGAPDSLPDKIVHNPAEGADFQDRSRVAAVDLADVPCQVGVNRLPE